MAAHERGDFLRKAVAVAQDKAADARLRADSIWVAGGLGMESKHEKMMTHEEVAQQCQFLLRVAADESEDARVRRVSITTLGNLKMKEGVPVVKGLLANKANHHRPDIARSACVALSELAPEDALPSLGDVLSGTTNSAVFGTAAYALGRIKNRAALPLLVANRQRLGDNLSVDNAIEGMGDTVLETLKKPDDPQIIPAIKATRSLWREEQREQYLPLLREILLAKNILVDTRREALARLMDEAGQHPLAVEQERLIAIFPLVEKDAAFKDEIVLIQQKLNARIIQPLKMEPTH